MDFDMQKNEYLHTAVFEQAGVGGEYLHANDGEEVVQHKDHNSNTGMVQSSELEKRDKLMTMLTESC